MSTIISVQDNNFQKEVLEHPGPVLVDFSAVWCGPCKVLEPIIEDLAAEWTGKVKVVKIDIDHSPNTPMQYHVMGVPTLMLFQDGKPLERITGFQPKKRIVSKLEQYITSG